MAIVDPILVERDTGFEPASRTRRSVSSIARKWQLGTCRWVIEHQNVLKRSLASAIEVFE